MTTAQISIPDTTRSAVPIGVATAAVAATASAYSAHTLIEAVVLAPVIAATAALVFGVLVPRSQRRESAGSAALALAIAGALLLLPAFWAGVPLVLAVGAMMLGNAGRARSSGSGSSIAGLAVGALVALGYGATYASEIVAGVGGFTYL